MLPSIPIQNAVVNDNNIGVTRFDITDNGNIVSDDTGGEGSVQFPYQFPIQLGPVSEQEPEDAFYGPGGTSYYTSTDSTLYYARHV